MDRRDFMKMMAAGAAAPGMFGFKEKIVEPLMPYLVPPEDVVPGIADWYTSICRQCSAGCGIQVRIREGRAKKIEGNPLCPVNRGRLCARGQAGLQVLYNPDRIKRPLVKENGKFREISWEDGLGILAGKLDEIRDKDAAGEVIFLSQPIQGNLAKLIKSFMESYGSEKVYSHELFNNEALIEANKLCFGYEGIPHYDIADAGFILSFGAGFLDTWISPVQYSAAYGDFRDKPISKRGRLVQFEPRLSLTGASADEWMPIKPGTQGLLALGIARVILDEKLCKPELEPETAAWTEVLAAHTPQKTAAKSGVPLDKLVELARRFAASPPSLALADGSVFDHVAANILNHLVGSIGIGGGILFSPPPVFPGVIETSIDTDGMQELAKEMSAGKVKALLVYNTNPAFTFAGNPDFLKGLERIPFIASFSSFMDETTAMADLILPDSTYLESWGDYIPIAGGKERTVVIGQPVVSKLYDTQQVGDAFIALGKMMGGATKKALPWKNFLDYLQVSWKGLYDDLAGKGLTAERSFAEFWEKVVESGGWSAGEAYGMEGLPTSLPRPDMLSSVPFKEPEPAGEEGFNLHLYPSHGLYDGGNANQPWLQQMPEPLTTVTWGSWAEINPETAHELGIEEGDLLKISSSLGEIEVPAYVFPAIEPRTIAMPIGQGHTAFGAYAKDRGANPLKLVASPSETSIEIEVEKTSSRREVVKTEPDIPQPGIEEGVNEVDRHLVQWTTYDEAADEEGKKKEPIKALPDRDLKKPSLFWSLLGIKKYRTANTELRPMEYRWGMVIDLDKCTGCQACMVACYSENNLPLVNEEEMARRRHKNWIRLDRYWAGEYPDVRAKFIPVNCPQCGNAPCEGVCPVYAAYGAFDGLNGQVYQRCIGTRYCNVNCPYRARVFNWFNPEWPEPMDQQLNPDISVRTSGIVDKCTFCVQRIREVKEKAKDEGRKVKDGEIQPACVQTCPTGAIVFGDLLDLSTRVSKLSGDARRYRLLEELNTEPAVIYLKAVREYVEREHE
ncbi:MAG: molybdopterin-dependent oxidoreductase [Candidatus Aquicultorales bacterium]